MRPPVRSPRGAPLRAGRAAPLLLAAALAASLPGCGSRTELRGCFADADCDDGVACTIDACVQARCAFTPVPSRCDDGVDCTVDICRPDGCVSVPDDGACDDGVDCTDDACGAQGCVSTPQDTECDDGIDCTVDTCGPEGCVSVPDDALCAGTPTCEVVVCDPAAGCAIVPGDGDPCDDGVDCTFDSCNTSAGECLHQPCDSLCTNDLFCDGVEQCDLALGCVAGPPACALGAACSADTCDEAGQQCGHEVAGGCLPPLRFLVGDGDGALLAVPAYGGPVEVIAPPDLKIHYDVALLGDRWFAIDTNPPALVELWPMTQQVKASFPVPGGNSLGAGPDGKLYAADTAVYRIDPDTGDWDVVAQLPVGYESSGDIAFLGDRMFVSTGGPCGSMLVEVNPATGAATPIGENGLPCVFGLAVSAGTLFVLDCSGKLGTFDPDTGVSHVLSTPDAFVFGADVLPP